jgi:hypothetical protein
VRIEDLERLLDDKQTIVEILPNGEIVVVKVTALQWQKPLTFRQELGGEYGR